MKHCITLLLLIPLCIAQLNLLDGSYINYELGSRIISRVDHDEIIQKDGETFRVVEGDFERTVKRQQQIRPARPQLEFGQVARLSVNLTGTTKASRGLASKCEFKSRFSPR